MTTEKDENLEPHRYVFTGDPDDQGDPNYVKRHDYINTKGLLGSQPDPLLRKVITISFFVALVVALLSSFGLALFQTGILEKHEIECNRLAEQLNSSLIVFDNANHTEEGYTGSFAALTCDVPLENRDLSACVIWKRRNNSIPRVDGVLSEGLSLHFKEVKATDQGEYYCVVCSNADCTKGVGTNFYLKITEKREPKDLNLDGPVDTIVRKGRTAYFYCYYEMDAPDNPKLSWYFLAKNANGRTTEVISTDRSKTNQSLKIPNVDESHDGFYTCQAKTDVGAKAVTARLEVNDGWARTKKRLTVVLGVFDGLALAVMTVVIFKLWYDRQKKNLKQWLKKVIVVDYIEKDGMKIPEVHMISMKTKGEIVGEGYSFPCDERYEVPRANVTLGKLLGTGNFGCVHQAEVRDLFNKDHNSIVAVKKLKDGYTDKDVLDLINEMEVMKMIPKHDNVINLLGCCTAPDGPLLVIVECAVNGSLIDYLRHLRKPNSDGIVPQKSEKETNSQIRQFLKFSFQIANGMRHLASVKCVHRDLAARNVLMDTMYNMKISDFGLARDIKVLDYYRLNTDTALPIHWMAPESLTDRKNDSFSDVWSYGVLLWEIFSLGLKPYPCISTYTTLIDLLARGERLEQPPRCPDVVYQIMNDCWTYEAKKRPDFTQLVERFLQLINTEDPDLLKPMSQTYMTDAQSESTVKSRLSERPIYNSHFNKGYVLCEINSKSKAE